MKKRTAMGEKLDNLYIYLKTITRIIRTSRYAKKRIKIIGGGYKGSSKEFNEKVKSYWKKYGVMPKKYWYTLLCNGRKEYEPRYIPDSMWYGKIQPYFNLLLFKRAYTDKGFYDIVFADLDRPELIFKNIAGKFFDQNNKEITKDQALDKCVKIDRFIIKPSLDSGSGRLIQFYDSAEMDITEIETMISAFKSNYVVQKIVKQHEELARIHRQSLNTIRVMSFNFKGEIHILSAQLRMGAGNSKVDNISAGGCACSIKPDGTLFEKSVNRKSQWTEFHPSGIRFKDIHVPSYDKIIEIVKYKHTQLPYFNIIGWDFAIREDGRPIFIEFNVTPEPNQIASGPTFGDLTEEVLEDVFIKKTYKSIMN